MRQKIIYTLIAVNLVLLTMVVGSALRLPQAFGQVLGLSGNFLMVAGEVMGTSSDVVYVVDLENRELLAVQMDRSTQEISIRGRRDLVRDLSVSPPEVETDRRTRRGRR